MIESLWNPVVLCFIAGFVAGVLKAELRFPEALYETISIYLLLAIGFKGGLELSETPVGVVIWPLCAALALGCMIPIFVFGISRKIGRLSVYDSAALSAHYGSVSAVTFTICLSYLKLNSVPYEGYVSVLLVALEIPAIVVAIALSKIFNKDAERLSLPVLRELFLGKSIYLLITGTSIGFLCGREAMEKLSPLFVDLFYGILALFLLEMGLIASRRLSSVIRIGPFIIGFALMAPIFFGFLGALMGKLSGMSLGGATILATLSASASYIAAPAAVRIAIPKANPSIYLTAALGITFPFNVLFGIPIYYAMTLWIYR